ncbi:MAG: IS110 family transposase [Chloroflexi bacterium]|nr:IS110 family transposase [Chloroflexota bacterium]
MLATVADAEDDRWPALARSASGIHARQLLPIDGLIAALESKLAGWRRRHPVNQCFAAIPGVGVRASTAPTAVPGAGTRYRSGWQFAAAPGLVPRQEGTDGKTKLKGTSRRGDACLQRHDVPPPLPEIKPDGLHPGAPITLHGCRRCLRPGRNASGRHARCRLARRHPSHLSWSAHEPPFQPAVPWRTRFVRQKHQSAQECRNAVRPPAPRSSKKRRACHAPARGHARQPWWSASIPCGDVSRMRSNQVRNRRPAEELRDLHGRVSPIGTRREVGARVEQHLDRSLVPHRRRPHDGGGRFQVMAARQEVRCIEEGPAAFVDAGLHILGRCIPPEAGV